MNYEIEGCQYKVSPLRNWRPGVTRWELFPVIDGASCERDSYVDMPATSQEFDAVARLLGSDARKAQ